MSRNRSELEEFSMPWQIWALIVGATVLVLAGIAFLWVRLNVFQWYCRRCQKDCVPPPISSKEMRMRRRRADSVFLHGLLELEHLSHLDLALRRLSVEGRDLGGRVSCSYRPVEMA